MKDLLWVTCTVYRRLHCLKFSIFSDAVIDCGGVRCLLKDLDDVLMKDVGGKIKQDGRCTTADTHITTCHTATPLLPHTVIVHIVQRASHIKVTSVKSCQGTLERISWRFAAEQRRAGRVLPPLLLGVMMSRPCGLTQLLKQTFSHFRKHSIILAALMQDSHERLS